MRPIGWRKRFRPSPPWDAGGLLGDRPRDHGARRDARRDPRGRDGADPRRRHLLRRAPRVARASRRAGRRSRREGVGRTTSCPPSCATRRRSPTWWATIDARLREGVVLMHHAPIDLAFLSRAYRRVGRPWPRLHVVDTLDLFMRLHRQRHRFTPHPPPPRTALSEAAPRRRVAAARRRTTRFLTRWPRRSFFWSCVRAWACAHYAGSAKLSAAQAVVPRCLTVPCGHGAAAARRSACARRRMTCSSRPRSSAWSRGAGPSRSS